VAVALKVAAVAVLDTIVLWRHAQAGKSQHSASAYALIKEGRTTLHGLAPVSKHQLRKVLSQVLGYLGEKALAVHTFPHRETTDGVTIKTYDLYRKPIDGALDGARGRWYFVGCVLPLGGICSAAAYWQLLHHAPLETAFGQAVGVWPLSDKPLAL
jgi:hypothetical protein